MASWFLSSNFPPNGANWGHWKNEIFDGALLRIERSSDPKEIEEQTRRAHEQLVDDAPWLWIVHDGNPRAMTKKVKGFANAQSWFQDFTLIEIAK
jgi:ABC-type transport system substrate-binding protein